jgi:hypothetical protein
MLPPDNHEELSFSEDDTLKVPFIYPGSENDDLSPDDQDDDITADDEDMSDEMF